MQGSLRRLVKRISWPSLSPSVLAALTGTPGVILPQKPLLEKRSYLRPLLGNNLFPLWDGDKVLSLVFTPSEGSASPGEFRDADAHPVRTDSETWGHPGATVVGCSV